MTKYELVEKYEDILRECAMAGIAVNDWRNAEIYRFVQKLRDSGHKMDYCVHQAMFRYVISEATVWRILKNMETPILSRRDSGN